MTIRNFIFVGLLTAFTSASLASNCSPLVAKIIEKTNATFERATQGGENVFLKHSDASSFSMHCGLLGPDIYVSWTGKNGAFPSNNFFTLVANASSVLTGRSANKIDISLHECHAKAIKAGLELAEIHKDGVGIECQSFKRDGGGTAFTVYMDKK